MEDEDADALMWDMIAREAEKIENRVRQQRATAAAAHRGSHFGVHATGGVTHARPNPAGSDPAPCRQTDSFRRPAATAKNPLPSTTVPPYPPRTLSYQPANTGVGAKRPSAPRVHQPNEFRRPVGLVASQRAPVPGVHRTTRRPLHVVRAGADAPQVPNNGADKPTQTVEVDVGSAGEDAFTRELRARDAEILQMRREKNGEIMNLRHRIRSLSKALEASKTPQEADVLAPQVQEHIAKLTSKRDEAVTEANVLHVDLKRKSELLAFAQKEISELREQLKKTIAGHEKEKAERLSIAEDFQVSGKVGSIPSGAAAPQGARPSADFTNMLRVNAVEDREYDTHRRTSAGTGGNTAVANGHVTQTPGYEMPKGPRKPIRRRPGSGGGQTLKFSGSDGGAAACMPETGPSLQGVEAGNGMLHGLGSGTQAVSPTQVLSRAVLSAEEMPRPPPPVRRNLMSPAGDAGDWSTSPPSTRKRPRTPEPEAEVQIVWAARELNSDKFPGVATQTHLLKEALFSEGQAASLLNMCSQLRKAAQYSTADGGEDEPSEEQDLSSALAKAIATEQDWQNLLKPLAKLCSAAGDSVTILSLRAICALVEHDSACRQALAMDESFAKVINTILEVLDNATSLLDCESAAVCMRIVSCVVAETMLLVPYGTGDSAMADSFPELSFGPQLSAKEESHVVLMRRALQHEAVLVWLQQRDPSVMGPCCAAAEIASEFIMNIVGTDSAHEDSREGDFLEQATLCLASTLPVLSVSETVKEFALSALNWTALKAPYLLDERDARVAESLCIYFVEVVHRMRIRHLLRMDARKLFCELVDWHNEAVPDCWGLSEEQDAAYVARANAADAQLVVQAIGSARRLCIRPSQFAALSSEMTGMCRYLAVSVLSALGWPELAGDAWPEACLRDFSTAGTLAFDARVLHDALVKSDPLN